jgi:hypothetical protein
MPIEPHARLASQAIAGMIAVCAKSAPMNNGGSPVTFASDKAIAEIQLSRMSAAFAEIPISVSGKPSLIFGDRQCGRVRL